MLVELACGLLSRQWEVVACLGTDGPLHTALLAAGVPSLLQVLPPWGPGTTPPPWRAGWLAAVRLARWCRQTDTRLLYAASPQAAVVGGLAMRMVGGRLVWRVHRTADWQSFRYAQACVRLAGAVHAATPAIHDGLCSLLGERAVGRVTLVPPGIDLAGPAPARPPARMPGELPVVGMVAAWSPRYGHEHLVKAFRLLQEGGQRARLRLAGAECPGGDRYRSMVASMVKAAGLGSRVSVEGPITDLSGFLAACDVVAIPVLEESTGRLALETARAGRPVVASRVGGLTEVVEDGHTGLLVPPGRAQGLADALEILLASPALRVEMGRQARLWVADRFSLEALLDAVEGGQRRERHPVPNLGP